MNCMASEALQALLSLPSGSTMAIKLARSVRYFVKAGDGSLHQQGKWLYQGTSVVVGPVEWCGKIQTVQVERSGLTYYALLSELGEFEILDQPLERS